MFKRSRKTVYSLLSITALAVSALTVTLLTDGGAAGAASIKDATPCASPAWSASYYANTSMAGTPVLSRCDDAINFSWGTGSPAAGVPVNSFSARWTSTRTMTAGKYRFSVTADDGVNVLMDGVSVVADWHDQNATTTTLEKTVTAGTHTFTMEYYDRTGSATAKFDIVNMVDDSPTQTKLIADDEFNGTSTVDPRMSIYNSKGSANPLARVPSMVTESGGMLHLVTTGNTGAGVCWCTASSTPQAPYRRYEIRAKMSAGNHNGGVIMLWPNAENWPVGGEIDIAELSTPTKQHSDFVVHYGAANHQALLTTAGDFTQWHTYTMEWTKTTIRYWIDGLLLRTITDPAIIPTGPMHLVAQVGPHGTDTASAPQSELDIDWIRAYT